MIQDLGGDPGPDSELHGVGALVSTHCSMFQQHNDSNSSRTFTASSSSSSEAVQLQQLQPVVSQYNLGLVQLVDLTQIQ